MQYVVSSLQILAILILMSFEIKLKCKKTNSVYIFTFYFSVILTLIILFITQTEKLGVMVIRLPVKTVAVYLLPLYVTISLTAQMSQMRTFVVGPFDAFNPYSAISCKVKVTQCFRYCHICPQLIILIKMRLHYMAYMH